MEKFHEFRDSKLQVEGFGLTFWTSDLHDGCRIDFPSTILNADPSSHVLLAGHKGRYTSYPHVFEMKGIEFVDDYRKLSTLIRQTSGHHRYIKPEDISRMYKYYKYDPIIAQVDAFICSFPASFCEAYLPYDKSIIFLPAHRYSNGRCNGERWKKLNEHLWEMAKDPKHIIAANNVYDQQYLKYYTGIEAVLLNSTSLFYTPPADLQFDQDKEILIGPLRLRMSKIPWFNVTSDKFQFSTAKDLYGFYHLNQVMRHPAIVLFPYAVMSFGMTELYAINIPIFAPSVDYIAREPGVFWDRSWHYGADWEWEHDKACMNLDPHTPEMEAFETNTHPYSPEDDSYEARRYWAQFSDYHQWEHITYFEDLEDLVVKLERADFALIRKKMKATNERRKRDSLRDWRNTMKTISRYSKARPFDKSTWKSHVPKSLAWVNEKVLKCPGWLSSFCGYRLQGLWV